MSPNALSCPQVREGVLRSLLHSELAINYYLPLGGEWLPLPVHNHVELFRSHDDKNREVPCNGRDHVTSHTSPRKSHKKSSLPLGGKRPSLSTFHSTKKISSRRVFHTPITFHGAHGRDTDPLGGEWSFDDFVQTQHKPRTPSHSLPSPPWPPLTEVGV